MKNQKFAECKLLIAGRKLLVAECKLFYSAEGAPTGQTPAQAPHSIQVSASITYLPSPSEIALTGHSASQAPQLMHSSLITYAMEIAPPISIDIHRVMNSFINNTVLFYRIPLICARKFFVNFYSVEAVHLPFQQMFRMETKAVFHTAAG